MEISRQHSCQAEEVLVKHSLHQVRWRSEPDSDSEVELQVRHILPLSSLLTPIKMPNNVISQEIREALAPVKTLRRL